MNNNSYYYLNVTIANCSRVVQVCDYEFHDFVDEISKKYTIYKVPCGEMCIYYCNVESDSGLTLLIIGYTEPCILPFS